MGIGAPQHEHDRIWLVIHAPNNRVGKLFPSFPAMRSGLGHFDRQDAVQQQHALLRPMLQKAIGRTAYAEIAFEFLVNIRKAWRRPDARRHAEAQPMGLARAVIGVLPQNDDPHPIERGQFKRTKPCRSFWIYRFASRLLGPQKPCKCSHAFACQCRA